MVLGEHFVQHSASGAYPFPVERFVFPALSRVAECSPSSDASNVIWPECDDVDVGRACARMAGGILDQLSGGENGSGCSLEHPKVVAITSPGDGDGKTGLLLALAPHLAKQCTDGILVADVNFRKPDLSTRLGLSADEASCTKAGCTDTQQSTSRQAILIYPTNVARLNVLAAPQRKRPESPTFDRSWIEQLREGWPLVLLDTASLAYPEVAPLTHWCDGVYLVVRLGHTAHRAVAQAARVVRGSGGRLLGCLVVG